MRDYRNLLSEDKFWDAHSQKLYEQGGEAREDAIQQNREEILALCEFIEQHQVRSYLEIGAWTGRLVSALHRVFSFDKVAACDDGWCEEKGLSFQLPVDCRFFRGRSDDAAFLRFRQALGPVDFVFIDANHHHHGVLRDFEIQRRFPNRFLAFHDITGANRHTQGVGKFWRELSEGHKLEILRPHTELGLDHSIMGIGIWSEHERIEGDPI